MRNRAITGAALLGIASRLCNADANDRRLFIRNYLHNAGLSYEEQSFGRRQCHGVNFAVKFEGNSHNILIISAHYDGPGAYDNAGGVAVLLGLIPLLGRDLHDTIYCCLFDKEERGQLGARHFLRTLRKPTRRVMLSLHMDGCGIGTACVALSGENPWTLQYGEKNIDINIAADFEIFNRHGIPAIHCFSLPLPQARAFVSRQVFPSTWHVLHTDKDSPKLLTSRALAMNLGCLRAWIHRIDGMKPDLIRNRFRKRAFIL